MHEIVTLQFGQRANYLATHFWNTQESYFTYAPNTSPSLVDHDVHFRPGIGADGSETYTPRTVIYDLKGGFGSLRKLNALYEDMGSSQQPQNQNAIVQGAWEGSTVTQRQPAIPLTKYQENLELGLPTTQLQDRDVRYWSDFNRVYFHPRSIVQLNEYSLHSQLTPFEKWSAGEELWTDVDKEADLLDRDVRLFVEEADQLQGFQIFAGTDDAWGGWTSSYVDALRDEFGKKELWVWGIEDGKRVDRDKIFSRAANSARSLSQISKQVSAYIRMSTLPTLPGDVDLTGNSEWKSTALIESAIESVTLPCRIRPGSVRQGSMSLFEQTLNTNGGQNVFELGARFVDGIQTTNGHGQSSGAPNSDMEASIFDINFSPQFIELVNNLQPRPRGDDNPNHVFAQVNVCRGPNHAIPESAEGGEIDREELMRRRFNDETIVEQYNVPVALPALDTFPDRMIQIPANGNKFRPLDELKVYSGLTCTSSLKRQIFGLRDMVTRGRTISVEEREEIYHEMTSIGEQYAFGWEEEESGEEDE